MRTVPTWAALALALFAAVPCATADGPSTPKPRVKVPEAVELIWAILHGSQMGPGEGWFHPGQARHDWEWLASRFDADHDGAVFRDEFTGRGSLFKRLDRDGDGAVTAEDLDWSAEGQYARQTAPITRLFYAFDRDRGGKLTRKEWDAFFDRAAGGRDSLTADDFRRALYLLPPRPRPGEGRPGAGGGSNDDDGPSPLTLLVGLAKSEVGSWHEGPSLNATAPELLLKTKEGDRTVSLAEFRGRKPVVLVFGNFTCGPFRAQVPYVESLYQRYRDKAEFLGVYVREAHPTDGWRMSFNDMQGVAIPQPKSKAERVSAAEKCTGLVGMTMPLLIDEMDDRAGNAYSGMPSRLYVIDRDGKVAYKSGRGPFGFKPGEMEQSLIMTLLDQDHEPKDAPKAEAAAK